MKENQVQTDTNWPGQIFLAYCCRCYCCCCCHREACTYQSSTGASTWYRLTLHSAFILLDDLTPYPQFRFFLNMSPNFQPREPSHLLCYYSTLLRIFYLLLLRYYLVLMYPCPSCQLPRATQHVIYCDEPFTQWESHLRNGGWMWAGHLDASVIIVCGLYVICVHSVVLSVFLFCVNNNHIILSLSLSHSHKHTHSLSLDIYIYIYIQARPNNIQASFISKILHTSSGAPVKSSPYSYCVAQHAISRTDLFLIILIFQFKPLIGMVNVIIVTMLLPKCLS